MYEAADHAPPDPAGRPPGEPTSTLAEVARLLLSGEEPAYKALFLACCVAVVAPLWAGDVLPFQDYAGNMSYAAILAGASEGTVYGEAFRTGGALLPNGMLFWSWAALGPLLGFVAAGKVLLTLYALALPVAVDRLLVAAGRHRHFALLAFPLVYNSSLMMGFASFASAIPVAIYTMARAYRFVERPTWTRGAMVSALSMLTFLGHAQAYLYLGIMAMAFVVTVPRDWATFWRTCAAFGASLLVFAPWAWDNFVAAPEESALGGRPLLPAFQSPGTLFDRLRDYTLSRWSGTFDDWTVIGMMLAAAVGLLDRRPRALAGTGRARLGLEVITLALFVSYLCVPEHTVVQAAIGSRVVTFVALLVLGWLHLPNHPAVRGALVWGMAFLSLWFADHVRAGVERFNEREMGPHFVSMLDALPDGSRLAVVVEDKDSDVVTVHAHEHIYGYHFGLNQGLAYSQFHSYYGRHAQWRPGHEVPYPGRKASPLLRWQSACWFDYLLVRSTDVPRWRAMEDRLTFIDSSARYSLWKLEHHAMPQCQEKEPAEDDAVAEGHVRRVVDAAIAAPLASTLSPKVGRARGRTMSGDWKPLAPRSSSRSIRRVDRARLLDDADEDEDEDERGADPAPTPEREPLGPERVDGVGGGRP